MNSITSTTNSTASTRSSSPCPTNNDWVSQAPVHPLAPLARDYPKPQEDVNVAEALQRRPLRWSVQGQIDANTKRQEALKLPSQDAELRRQDLQQVKDELLASYSSLNSRSKQ